MAKNLDFVVIGAQKAGTTSLHRYLQKYPGLFVGTMKDFSFFTHDDRLAAGWDDYALLTYRGAPDGVLWGEVSSKYMRDPRVPQRILELMPAVRLIAMLRNPIERAQSHYRMAVRRGLEQRTFAEAVVDQLDPSSLEDARLPPSSWEASIDHYLAWGEYGRVLEGFLRHFAREQLLVLFTDDLGADPTFVMSRIMTFLGLPLPGTPPDLSRRHNVDSPSLPLTQRSLLRVGRGLSHVRPLRWAWGVLPQRLRWRIGTTLVQERTHSVETKRDDVPQGIRDRLVDFYRGDVALTETLVGARLPWQEFA